MKIRNGQSKQYNQNNPKQNQHLSFNHQNLLDQMYDRVCNQQNTTQEYSNIKPLLSYLSISGQNSQVEEKTVSPHFDQQQILPASSQQQNITKIYYPKKYSMQERIKTDMHEMNTFADEEMETLRLENELLRKKLIKCQKKIIRLESFQSEVEYLKKLSFLQHTQIEKLRVMLRHVQLEEVENTLDNFRSIESQQKSLKQSKPVKSIAVKVTQPSCSAENLQKKKARCSYKQNLSRKDKQNEDYRTQSVFQQTKNKRTIDKSTKRTHFQQKSNKLKNRKTSIRYD